MVRSTLALAAVLSVASASLAEDLVTPALFIGPSTNGTCKLTNITSAPIPAQVQVIGSTGTVLDDSGPITVAAGSTEDLLFLTPNDVVHCRFVKASKSKVRADMTVFVAGASDNLVVVAQ